MNELIKIESREISGATVQTCNARDLWQFVESKQDFSDWITNRIAKYSFVDGEDFSINLWKTPDGGRPRKDYHLTIETAKELAMVENNEKGRQVRRYFIECERRAKAAPDYSKLSTMQILQIAMQAEQERLQLEHKVEELTPKAEALDRIADADGLLNPTGAAKALQVQPKKLFDWLRAKQWIYRRPGGSGNVAYQDKIQAGYLTHKITTQTREDGSDRVFEQVLITPKGLAKLSQAFSGTMLQ